MIEDSSRFLGIQPLYRNASLNYLCNQIQCKFGELLLSKAMQQCWSVLFTNNVVKDQEVPALPKASARTNNPGTPVPSNQDAGTYNVTTGNEAGSVGVATVNADEEAIKDTNRFFSTHGGLRHHSVSIKLEGWTASTYGNRPIQEDSRQ